jgi:hypothetical protein
MPYPQLLRVHQRFDAPRLPDVPAAIRDQFARIRVGERVRPGQSIAVAVGSRGIDRVALVVRTIADLLRECGARVFLVPAMGSHGGGTAEGQRAVLESYGITEAAIDAPIRSSMEAVRVGTTDDGIPVWWDQHAYEADGVVLVNRIKPHTSFCGRVESGLLKMAMIGLGKRAGASVMHRAAVHHEWEHLVESVGGFITARCPLLAGLAIVENAYDQIGRIEAITPAEFLARETDLLTLARRWMPRLPVERIDLLVVDEMGKNISGLGMDSNVTGRKDGLAGDDGPRIGRIFVRALTAESHGNAHGIGLADFTTTRLVRSIDYRATIVNSMTALHPEASYLPMHFDTDREAIDAALSTIGLVPPEQARVVRVRNTLKLGEALVSDTCRDELDGRPDVEIVGAPAALAFDADGNLGPFEGSR